MEVILLYSGDAWLSRESMDVLAVYDSREAAVKMAVECSGFTDEPLTIDDERELLEMCQTYGRNENFMITAVRLNSLC